MKNVNTTYLEMDRNRKMSTFDVVKSYFAMQQKITERDLEGAQLTIHSLQVLHLTSRQIQR